MAIKWLVAHRIALATATALASPALLADSPAVTVAPQATTPDLELQFRDPPQSARPRVWWHWMNGNITKDGIAKDLAWMKRVGIGGLQTFDANLQTPKIVDERLVYMTPGWKDAFRFTTQEADRLGLELAIAASPGWSETGGPWVKPEDGLKKLVWSETTVEGGRRSRLALASPPAVTGPFQSAGLAKDGIDNMMSGSAPKAVPTFYADVAVVAFPIAAPPAEAQPEARDGDGNAVALAALADRELESSVELPRPKDGSRPMLVYTYPRPQTIGAASLYLPGAAAMFMGAPFSPYLEASDDGRAWRKLGELPLEKAATTISFAPVTARHFRLVLGPPPKPPYAMSAPAPGLSMGGDLFEGLARRMAAKPIRIGDFRLFAEPKVDRFETKAGFSVEPDYYALSKGVPEAAGVDPASVIDLTARLRPDGTLDWTPPKGTWRIVRYGYSLLGTENHPAPPEATGLEVDKFDGPAVRRYMEHYLAMYREAAGTELVGRRGVQAVLTDSIEVGAANWTPRMIEQFRTLRGYDPVPWMPALSGTVVGSRAKSDAFLYDYRRTLADLMASEHYGTVARVAREHGLRVYGEALENGRPSLGDDMSMRRFADIPMAAMWTHTRAEGPRPSHLADLRGAASVAHIYGQNLVAAESLTASMNPWNYGPADLKRIIDLEFVNGVNRPVIHTSVHQPVDDKVPGLSLFIFGQYFNRHEAWAELAKPWIDYISRNALMLQQGRNVADVGYFYGEEAPLTALMDTGQLTGTPRRYAYDFVSADALATSLKVDGNELVTSGGAHYRALYLGGSSRRMTLATLRRLADLVEKGATVVGLRPEGNPGLGGDDSGYAALVAKLWPGGEEARVGRGRVLATTDIELALAKLGATPDFAFSGALDGADIPFVHRKLADGDSWFLVNRRDRTETIEARFRVTGKAPELWHAETGELEPVSYRIEDGTTVVPVTLQGDQSVHVVFRKPAKAAALTIERADPSELASLSGAWNVSFQPGRGAPASAELPMLAPLDENALDGIRHFSGIATYTKDFDAPRGWKPGQPLWLDLGEAREVAEVTVNGKAAGSLWHAPYRLDIAALAKRGRNRLTVRVANLWVNRLIGDQQQGAQKVTWTSLPTYRADAPLRRSGLIGPVTLWGSAR